MKLSKGGGVAGFIFDTLAGSFPIGTIIGTFAKNFVNFDANDMDRAHDPGAARASSSFDFGDLKGMANGLFGKVENIFSDLTNQQRSPETEAALRTGRPRTDEGARKEAQSKTGFRGWGKAIAIGAAVLAGLALFSGVGAWGWAGYGGYSPFMC